MKFWQVLVVFLICSNLNAQVMGTPISVTEEGQTQKPGEDAEVAKARSELEASKVKPSATEDSLGVKEDQSPDGTLVDQKNGETKKEEKVENVEAKSESSFTKKWKKLNFFAARRWFRLNAGHVWSRWEKVSPELKDGSLLTGFRLVQPIEETNFEVGFGIDFLHGGGDSFNAESIRSTHIALEIEYLKTFSQYFSGISGLGLEYADSNIRKAVANNSSEVTFKKYAAGATFGAVPELGIRAIPGANVTLDLVGGYSFYFGSPYDKMGGPFAKLRFNIGL